MSKAALTAFTFIGLLSPMMLSGVTRFILAVVCYALPLALHHSAVASERFHVKLLPLALSSEL